MAQNSDERKKVASEPNVVPLCDVLLVLLIIFMIITPMVQKGVDVKLPSAFNITSMPDNPEVTLHIKKDGTLYVNEDKTTLENLQTMLEEAFLTTSEKKVYLRADQDLEYGVIVDVINEIKAADIKIVGIITEKKTAKID